MASRKQSKRSIATAVQPGRFLPKGLRHLARLQGISHTSALVFAIFLAGFAGCGGSNFAKNRKHEAHATESPQGAANHPPTDSNPYQANKDLEEALASKNKGTDSEVKNPSGNTTPEGNNETRSGPTVISEPGTRVSGDNLPLSGGSESTESFAGAQITKKKIMIVVAIDTSGSMQPIVDNSMKEIARVAKNLLSGDSVHRFTIIGSDQELAPNSANLNPVRLSIPLSIANLEGFAHESTFVDSCDSLGEISKSLRAKGSNLQQFNALHLLTVSNDNAGPGDNDPTFCFGTMKEPANAISAETFVSQLNSIKSLLPAHVSFHNFSFRGNLNGICAEAAGTSGTQNEFIDKENGKWRRGFEYEKLKSLFPWKKHTTGDVCTSNWQSEFAAPENEIKESLSVTLTTAKTIRSVTRVSVNGQNIPLENASFAGNQLKLKQSLPDGAQITVTYRSDQ